MVMSVRNIIGAMSYGAAERGKTCNENMKDDKDLWTNAFS
jgi:hypothetical protein